MSETASNAPGNNPGALDVNRWKALAFIAMAQLMVTLDTRATRCACSSPMGRSTSAPF